MAAPQVAPAAGGWAKGVAAPSPRLSPCRGASYTLQARIKCPLGAVTPLEATQCRFVPSDKYRYFMIINPAPPDLSEVQSALPFILGNLCSCPVPCCRPPSPHTPFDSNALALYRKCSSTATGTIGRHTGALLLLIMPRCCLQYSLAAGALTATTF